MNLIENRAGIASLKIVNGFVDENKKVPQYVHFRCWRVHINSSLKKIGIRCKVQLSLLKQELEHDEIYEDTWEGRENEWIPLVKNDALSTAFCYAKYTMSMEELTSFGMKNKLTFSHFSKQIF